MPEQVRLIIWDLDETFWQGTLTEGGIIIREDTCALVKSLTARGIMNSICSKNNFDDVRAVLEREGIWKYFIFPSISWEPKGPRIAAMVETVQLRPPTIMFIDDNPLNLEEVRHFVPDIQVQSHEFIPKIAASPLFTGKDDRALSRLQQYKLMETRKQDEQQAGGDNTEFLRGSDIRVEFERDVEGNIDRVVELINRTNQLNFTKTRLPEDQDEARSKALALVRRYNVQAALLRVSDRYGDHGFTGLYVTNSEHNHLLHFCFSCRILGMGVEQWLYALLGRPRLEVRGEVLSNPKDTSRTIDWINQRQNEHSNADIAPLSLDRMIAHGGCDLSAIGHYFGVNRVKIVPEFNIMRNGMSLRVDHSQFLRYAMDGITDGQIAIARKLQYEPKDFTSALFDRPNTECAVLLSFATDAHHALYRHRATGLTVPCLLGLGPVFSDQRHAELPLNRAVGREADILKLLREEFDFVGLTLEPEFKHTLRDTFERLSGHARVFVLRPCDYHLNKVTGDRWPDSKFVDVNTWTQQVANGFDNVTILDIPDFIRDNTEVENILHYDRKVYFRIYQSIAKALQHQLQVA